MEKLIFSFEENIIYYKDNNSKVIEKYDFKTLLNKTNNEQNSLLQQSIPNEKSILYYNLLCMLYIGDTFKNNVIKELFTTNYKNFVYEYFDELNFIFSSYPYEYNEKIIINNWTNEDLKEGREILTDKIPNKYHKYNFLLLNGMPVKIIPNYNIYIVSNRINFVKEIQKELPQSIHFDGTGYNNFSKLINNCVENSDKEIMVILSDKVRPKQEHIDLMINKLTEGYAFVTLFSFACFCFKKDLFRNLCLDEGFVGGGHEDGDFYHNIKYLDLPMYNDVLPKEVGYMTLKSTWNYGLAENYKKQIILENNKNYLRLKDIPKLEDIGDTYDKEWYNNKLNYNDSLINCKLLDFKSLNIYLAKDFIFIKDISEIEKYKGIYKYYIIGNNDNNLFYYIQNNLFNKF